jgi:hypothetical protein
MLALHKASPSRYAHNMSAKGANTALILLKGIILNQNTKS